MPGKPKVLLSRKLDDLIKRSQYRCPTLFDSLGDLVLETFEGAAKGIAPTVDAMESTKKYSEEMSHAAAQMESLNSSVQSTIGKRQQASFRK